MWGNLIGFIKATGQANQSSQMVPYTPKEPDYTPVLIGAGLLIAVILLFKKK